MGAIKMTTVEVQGAVTISDNLEEATSSARLWSSGFISAGHWIVNPEDWCESVNRTPLCISVIVLHTLFPSNFCITFCTLEVLCPDLLMMVNNVRKIKCHPCTDLLKVAGNMILKSVYCPIQK